MNLHLMHCLPDPAKLAAWSVRHGLLSSDDDYGYALHALLSAAFGDQSPKPFCYLGGRQGLLAYSELNGETLKEHASLATPDVAAVLGLDNLQVRSFPTAWQRGQRVGFQVRLRPVVRTQDGRERDAFLHAVESNEGDAPGREAVYASWLTRQIEADNAAQVIHAGMEGFRLLQVVRRRQMDEAGKRKLRGVTGPVTRFSGELEIGDGDAFARLVARGIGRHRSFGFGMLLLRPSRSC